MIEIHHKQTSSLKPNQPWLPSVHGVVLNNAKAILVHQREDHPFWALPGGKIDPGESLVDCLKREMKEETGLEVAPEKLLGVFSSSEYLLSAGEMVFQPLLIVFLCKTIGGRLTPNSESLSFEWLNQENMETSNTFPLIKEIACWTWDNKEGAFFDETSFCEIKKCFGIEKEGLN